MDITDEQALVEHSLALLAMRRHISLLGLLHKIVLGQAPAPIEHLFSRKTSNLRDFGIDSGVSRHDRQLHDPIEPGHSPMIRRSVFGMIRIYNSLPQRTVSLQSVKSFQRALQKRARDSATDATVDWQLMFSPRAG